MPKESNKEKALAALLTTNSITAAAAECGMTPRTLYKYLAEPEFKREFRAARSAIVETAVSMMQTNAKRAVETLVENLTCEVPAVSTRAAQIIYEASVKGVEMTDIIERLEALEDATNQPKT